MIRFGPAGNCDRFYQEGNKSTLQAPGWIARQGLTAFEYSAGRGVALGEDTARAIGKAAREAGVTMSIHAPYYINCASPDPEKQQKTLGYLLDAARACDYLGGNRVIFHVGSPTKLKREKANENAVRLVGTALSMLEENHLGHILLCPETMGRPSQLGTLEETLTLCRMDQRLLPTLDFGHLHTMGIGCLNTREDFDRVLTAMINSLGMERSRHFHAHFSHIEYTAKGERRHMRFCDPGYGPDFALLAPLLHKYRLEPTIICESSGTQADDALIMQQMYLESAP